MAKPEPALYPSLHPNLVRLYKREVAALEDALNDRKIWSEAGEILRSLIDRIVIAPSQAVIREPDKKEAPRIAEWTVEPSEVEIVLYGELATVIGLAEDDAAFENKGRFSLSAGARNQLYRTAIIWRKSL